jgi:tetratricopeptide (TPR) repeat protein
MMLIAILLAGSVTLPPPERTLPPPEPVELTSILSDYLSTLRRYEAGDHGAAVQALAVQPLRVVEAAARALREADRREATGATPRDLEAAALMHTDLALRDAYAPSRVRMLDTAEELLAIADAPPKPARCRWLQAIGLYHHGRYEIDAAIARYKHAVEVCPNDAYGWALLGQAFEAREPARPVVPDAPGAPEAPAYSRGADDAHLRPALSNSLKDEMAAERTMAGAERAYRHALALNTEPLPELRLHLARARAAMGRLDEAERDIAAVLEKSADAEVRYVGHLLLGDIKDTRGKLDDALPLYRVALEIHPRSQVATLALSHDLHRLHRRRESSRVVTDWIQAERGAAPPFAEPWWFFTEGATLMQAPQEAILSSLRRELMP